MKLRELLRFNFGEHSLVVMCNDGVRRSFGLGGQSLFGLYRKILPQEAWDKEWPLEMDFEAEYARALPLIDAHAQKTPPSGWYYRHLGNPYRHIAAANDAKDFYTTCVRLQKEGKHPALYIKRLW